MWGGSSSSSAPYGGTTNGSVNLVRAGGRPRGMPYLVGAHHQSLTGSGPHAHNSNMGGAGDPLMAFTNKIFTLITTGRQDELGALLTVNGPHWGFVREMATKVGGGGNAAALGLAPAMNGGGSSSSSGATSIPPQLERAVTKALNANANLWADGGFHQENPFLRFFETPSEQKPRFKTFLESFVMMVKLYNDALQFGLTPKAKPLLTASLEHCATCLKTWATVYCNTRGEYEAHIWMIPAFQILLGHSREQAINIDLHFNTDNNENANKIVETLRNIFAEMLHEKQKRAGFLATTVELVRCCLYMFQISLVENVLKNVVNLQIQVQKASGGGTMVVQPPGFPVAGVPPSISVTLAYYWGVVLVQGAKYAEAEGKLWWGYSQLVADSQNSRSQQMQIGTLPSCDHRKQRRQMLYFLIPLRIRKGILPSQELLKSYDLDGVFGKLVDAIRAGDLALYELAAKEQTLVFVKLGIVNLMSQVRHIVARQFIKQIVNAYCVAANVKEEKSLKIDLTLFVACFESQYNAKVEQIVQELGDVFTHYTFSEVETLLAQMIAFGGMKGYLTIHHNKVVIPRVGAFPSIEDFCESLDVTIK